MRPSPAGATSLLAQYATESNPFAILSYGLMVASLVAGPAIALYSLTLALAVAAIAWGWTEIGGLCGTSHLGAITWLRAVPAGKPVWLRAMTLYTLGGCVTGAIVGSLLGALGEAAGIETVRKEYYTAVGVIALICTAREFRLLSFPLPQVRLQTRPTWFYDFGHVMSAAMWGMHIGLGLVTVVRYGGFWILVLCVVGTADVFEGAVLFSTYWLGRTLPIWITPYVLPSSADAVGLNEDVSFGGRAYNHLAGCTLLWAGVVLLFV